MLDLQLLTSIGFPWFSVWIGLKNMRIDPHLLSITIQKVVCAPCTTPIHVYIYITTHTVQPWIIPPFEDSSHIGTCYTHIKYSVNTFIIANPAVVIISVNKEGTPEKGFCERKHSIRVIHIFSEEKGGEKDGINYGHDWMAIFFVLISATFLVTKLFFSPQYKKEKKPSLWLILAIHCHILE